MTTKAPGHNSRVSILSVGWDGCRCAEEREKQQRDKTQTRKTRAGKERDGRQRDDGDADDDDDGHGHGRKGLLGGESEPEVCCMCDDVHPLLCCPFPFDRCKRARASLANA